MTQRVRAMRRHDVSAHGVELQEQRRCLPAQYDAQSGPKSVPQQRPPAQGTPPPYETVMESSTTTGIRVPRAASAGAVMTASI